MKTFDTIDEECSSINSTEASNEEMLNSLYGQKTTCPNRLTNAPHPWQSAVVSIETDEGHSSKKPEDLCLASNQQGQTPLDKEARLDESPANIKSFVMPHVPVRQNLDLTSQASSGPSNSLLQLPVQGTGLVDEKSRMPSITDSTVPNTTSEGSYIDHIVAYNDTVSNACSDPSTTLPLALQSKCLSQTEKISSTFCENVLSTISEGRYIDHNIKHNGDVGHFSPDPGTSVSQLKILGLKNKSSSFPCTAINTTTDTMSEGGYIDHINACNGDIGLLQSTEADVCSSTLPKLHDSVSGSELTGPPSERNCATHRVSSNSLNACHSTNTVTNPNAAATSFSPYLPEKDLSVWDAAPLVGNYVDPCIAVSDTNACPPSIMNTESKLKDNIHSYAPPPHSNSDNCDYVTYSPDESCSTPDVGVYQPHDNGSCVGDEIFSPLSLTSQPTSPTSQPTSLSPRNTLPCDHVNSSSHCSYQAERCMPEDSSVYADTDKNAMPYDSTNNSDYLTSIPEYSSTTDVYINDSSDKAINPSANFDYSVCKDSNQCNCTSDIPATDTSEVGVYASHNSATNSDSKLACNIEDTSTGQCVLCNTTAANGGMDMLVDATQTSCYLPHSFADINSSV